MGYQTDQKVVVEQMSPETIRVARGEELDKYQEKVSDLQNQIQEQNTILRNASEKAILASNDLSKIESDLTTEKQILLDTRRQSSVLIEEAQEKARIIVSEGQKQVDQALGQLSDAKKVLDDRESELKKTKENIDVALKDLEERTNQFTPINDKIAAQLIELNKRDEDQKKTKLFLDQGSVNFDAQRAHISELQDKLNSDILLHEENVKEYQSYIASFKAAQDELNDAKKNLSGREIALSDIQKNIDSQNADLASARQAQEEITKDQRLQQINLDRREQAVKQREQILRDSGLPLKPQE